MNIDEYRAMIAQDKEQAETQTEGGVADVPTVEGATIVPEQAVQTENETSGIPEQGTPQTETTPAITEVDVNGTPIPVEELTNGYLRQSDYTRKTQELAQMKSNLDIANQYYQAIQTDPEFAENIARRFDLPYMSAEEAQTRQMQDELNSLRLDRDIAQLQAKHGNDIPVREILQTAYDKQLGNLEDAYTFVRAQSTPSQPVIDTDKLREEIRQQVLSELQSNVDTSTIIGTGGSSQQVKSSTPDLTPDEARVAANMSMTPAEYAKWKNA